MRRLFKRRFDYYVVYECESGKGTMGIAMDVKIKTIEDIRVVESYIKEKCNHDNVVLVNWIRLSS